jgi:hypothetical protein
MKQYAAIDDTVYFWFAANTTSGSGGDGASPAADVRLAGAAPDAAPVYSPTPALLSHANYPAGAYEIAITASVANGFATGNTYAVFCTLAIDSQNPTGFVGSFDTKPVESNITQIGDVTQSATDLKDMVDTGYDPVDHKVQGVVLADTVTALTGHTAQTGDSFARLGSPAGASIAADLVVIDNFVDDLETRLSAVRAGYLDNLSAGAVALDSGVDLTKIHGVALTETINGYLAAAFVKLFDVATPLLVASNVMRGTDSAALAATALTDVTWTDAKAAFIDAAISSRSVPNEYDTVIAALQTDLDNPAQYKADVSALATAAAISTHDGKLDTVDTNIDSILLDTDELQIDWTNGGRLDLLIDRLIAANEVEATTVTDATSSTTFAATGLLDDTDNHYNDGVMVFTSGANRGQPKRILDFTGATKEITVSAAFETTPSIGDSFVITTQLAAAAAAGGDATATNQVAMIVALDAIKGSGWTQADHSLAERPVGGAGGGGHCAWYDDDLDRANKFFKASPSKFKEILENLTSIKKKLSEVDSDSTIVDSISKNNTTMSYDLNTIRNSIAELSKGLKMTDSLLISMADAASLEELLDEAQ